jgi:hypothetical protein
VPPRRTADGSEAQKSNRVLIPVRSLLQISFFSNRRSVTPTKINRVGREAVNGTWARTGRNAVGTKQIAPKNARFF